MFADCERLVVLRIVSPEEAEVMYDGPGKNGQRRISLRKLRGIAANLV